MMPVRRLTPMPRGRAHSPSALPDVDHSRTNTGNSEPALAGIATQRTRSATRIVVRMTKPPEERRVERARPAARRQEGGRDASRYAGARTRASHGPASTTLAVALRPAAV